jgi:predicted nucleotide-binding protein
MRVQLHLQNDMHLKVEEWESKPRAGHHNVEVLKGILDACGFAVIVATAEDATRGGGVRARQNVVHEIGLFQGRLGFEKVAILMQDGVQEFSNLAGLQVITFPGDEVKAAFHDLDEMLRREGMVK